VLRRLNNRVYGGSMNTVFDYLNKKNVKMKYWKRLIVLKGDEING